MGDTSAHSPFLSTRSALSHTPFGAGTPSQLTPNTRSEAEAALSANSSQQTDSAAPTMPLLASSGASTHLPANMSEETLDAARAAYRCLPNPSRTSTSNYATALAAATTTTDAADTANTADTADADSPTSAVSPTNAFPINAAQGVVPLKIGIGAGQAEALKRARPTGLSLGHLARQQSWSEQDMKHVYSQSLMVVDGATAEDAGYSSAGPVEG